MSRKLFSLDNLLGESLKALGLEKQLLEQACVSAWDEVVGERIAAAAQPEFIKDGKLFVITKSSTWANELSFLKEDIMKRLNERVGKRTVKEMVFRAGKVEKKEKQEQKKEDIELTTEEIKEAEEEALKNTSELSDPARKMLIEIMKYNKWKRKKGWKPCRICGALQDSERGICPPCERERGENV